MAYANLSDFHARNDNHSPGSLLKSFVAFMNAWIEKSRLFAVI